jgi:hypothetical protein
MGKMIAGRAYLGGCDAYWQQRRHDFDTSGLRNPRGPYVSVGGSGFISALLRDFRQGGPRDRQSAEISIGRIQKICALLVP